MRVVLNLKREIKSADIKNLLICIAVAVVASVITYIFTGGLRVYYQLLIPNFFLPLGIYTVIRLLMFAVAGVALGLIIGNCDTCRKKVKITGIVLFAVLMVLCILRSALLFSHAALITGFILSLAILVVNFFVMRYFVKISIISGFLMLLFFLWNTYCALVSFCLMILN